MDGTTSDRGSTLVERPRQRRYSTAVTNRMVDMEALRARQQRDTAGGPAQKRDAGRQALDEPLDPRWPPVPCQSLANLRGISANVRLLCSGAVVGLDDCGAGQG